MPARNQSYGRGLGLPAYGLVEILAMDPYPVLFGKESGSILDVLCGHTLDIIGGHDGHPFCLVIRAVTPPDEDI